MHIDPMQNWRSLTDNYSRMSDGELLALADDFVDLTDTARQVLRDEMRKRGLGDPQEYAAGPAGAARRETGFAPAADGEDESHDEFVWKNVLCECGSHQEAWRIREALRRAGIESWADGKQTSYTPLPETGGGGQPVRVLVASDTLDEARAVIAQPLPQDIVELSKAEEAVYEPPVCPGCGADDPVLESADPVNSWKCDICGREWTETAEATPQG